MKHMLQEVLMLQHNSFNDEREGIRIILLHEVKLELTGPRIYYIPGRSQAIKKGQILGKI